MRWLIALAIGSMVLVAVSYCVDAAFRAYSINQEQSDLMQRSRLAMHRILTAVRTTDAHAPVDAAAKLGFEMGLTLRGEYRLRQVRHVLVIADVDAPDGVVQFGRPPVDDWVSIDIAPKNVNEFQAFSASQFIAQLRQSGARYWVYSTGTSTAGTGTRAGGPTTRWAPW